MTSSPLIVEENQAAVTPDLPGVTDHACYCFYAVQPAGNAFPPQVQRTLADLLPPADADKPASRPWIPAAARATIVGQRLQQAVWEAAPLDIGTDLRPHLRRLLGAPDSAEPRHICAYRPTNPVRRLLRGQWLSYPPDLPAAERTPPTLAMPFSPAARRRLARWLGAEPDCPLLLSSDDLRFVFFRTGHAFLIATMTFRRADDQPLHPYWLVEAVSNLARINTLCWHGGTPGDEQQTFSLGDIVRSLAGGNDPPRPERRVFTASYLQFTTAPEPQAARRLAVQLSRHYTDHYRIAPELADFYWVADKRKCLDGWDSGGGTDSRDYLCP